MTNKISTYEALLMSHASKGDCTAFHSLVAPHLTAHYCKLIDDGVSQAEATAKVCATGVSLYKRFIGSSPESFDSWLKSNSENITSGNMNETDFLQSDASHNDQQMFRHKLLLEMQRYSSSQQLKRKSYGSRIFGIFRKPKLLLALSLLVIIAAAVLYFVFSSTSIGLLIVNKTTNSTIVFPESFRPQASAVTITDTIRKQVVVFDTTVKADTTHKPRPRIRKPVILNPDSLLQSGAGSSSDIFKAFESSPAIPPRTSEPAAPPAVPAKPLPAAGTVNSEGKQ